MTDITPEQRAFNLAYLGNLNSSNPIHMWAFNEIEKLTKERDEARQKICVMQVELPPVYYSDCSYCSGDGCTYCWRNKSPRDVAKENGWDCYKEETKESRLKAKGWQTGSAEDFLGSEETPNE